jgi:S1-C subfamily serine protease
MPAKHNSIAGPRRCTLLLLVFWVLCAQDRVLAQTAKAIAAQSFPSVVLLLMEDQRGQPISLGSGFFVQGGFVATNMHVIRGATRGIAKLVGKSERAEILGVVATDTARDLALLHVKGLTAPLLPIGESKKVSIGEEAFVIGNPQGLEGTVSQGIVSGLRKVSDMEVIQITAPISPGSSGGPVLDRTGQVIGVAVATFKGGQNLNFAIPSDYLAALLVQPKKISPLSSFGSKKEQRPTLGELGGKSAEGVIVSSLVCKPDNEYITPGEWLCSFSLVNHLQVPVKNVKYLVILYSSKGEPLDTREGSYLGSIRPGLAARPVNFMNYTFDIPHEVKRMTSKIEVRILDFVVEES